MSILSRILAIALALSLVFGGWNWYRKNHYYNELQNASAQRTKDAQKATEEMQRAANLAATQTAEKQRARREAIQSQLDYLTANPVVRTEYRVRDRWRTGTCPAGADGQADDVPGTGSGLHPELERYALRSFGAADDVVDERNLCVALYNRARAAALKWNEDHGR